MPGILSRLDYIFRTVFIDESKGGILEDSGLPDPQARGWGLFRVLGGRILYI